MVESKAQIVAYIGLGSNLGDREKNLANAFQALCTLPDSCMRSSSSIYETEPWGMKVQADFLNQVVEIETILDAYDLFEACQTIEKKLGRLSNEKWGPRVIDIDILLYSDSLIEERGLKIPHPQITNRRFVLVPLSEIAPTRLIPDVNLTVEEALAYCQDKGKVNLYRAVTNNGGRRC